VRAGFDPRRSAQQNKATHFENLKSRWFGCREVRRTWSARTRRFIDAPTLRIVTSHRMSATK
jgi:hypothetical protein